MKKWEAFATELLRNIRSGEMKPCRIGGPRSHNCHSIWDLYRWIEEAMSRLMK